MTLICVKKQMVILQSGGTTYLRLRSRYCYYKVIFAGCLPQTRHARDCRKKGSRVYISAKVFGCLGSHCSTARLADTYRVVAFTGFIAMYSTAWEKHGPGKKIQPLAATELKIAKSQGGWRKYNLARRRNNQPIQCVNTDIWINNSHYNRPPAC